MEAALIGLAGVVVAAVVSALVARQQAQSEHTLSILRSRIEEDAHKRQALFDRTLAAEEVVTRYREPLAAAAFDLQSRLYNILCLGFFDKFGHGPRREEAIRTTLFRLAQYFGWSELLRRDIQFLSFPEDEDTRHVADLQARIARCFLTDHYGPALMLWSDEQRAIGERMIVEEHGKVLCMGYATFRESCKDKFAGLQERLAGELEDQRARARMRDAQHVLCELVETLDSRGVRYSEKDLLRAEIKPVPVERARRTDREPSGRSRSPTR